MIMMKIAAILGSNTRLDRFSFAIFGKNFVAKRVKKSTIAGCKEPAMKTKATGAIKRA